MSRVVHCAQVREQLLQLRVLGLGLFQDGDVWVDVFLEGEKVLACGASLEGITQAWHGREAIKNSQSSRRCWLRSILKKPDVGRREKVCPKS